MLVKATLADYPVIQNMARFYAYDMSRYCGQELEGWEFPDNGLYECSDFKKYLEGEGKHAFVLKMDDELAGFVFVNKLEIMPEVDWNIGEFFIVAKFQHSGIGAHIAMQIFDMFPGEWSVGAIPQNTRALHFWRKVVAEYTHGKFDLVEKTSDQLKTTEYPDPYPMTILRFKAPANKQKINNIIRKAQEADISAMVALSDQKRKAYEKAQPIFWRRSNNANESQVNWFGEILLAGDYIMLVAQANTMLDGFIIGRLVCAPEVYQPGGTTLMIDDFCVAQSKLWYTTGNDLISEIKQLAKEKGTVQILVVSGHHDEDKRQFLKSVGLSIVSEWYANGI